MTGVQTCALPISTTTVSTVFSDGSTDGKNTASTLVTTLTGTGVAPVLGASGSASAGYVLVGQSANASVTITNTYDDRGNRISFSDSMSAAGAATQLTFDGAFNQITSTTDELGHRTTYELDAKGSNLKTVFADGSFLSYAYNARGLVTREVDADEIGLGDGASGVSPEAWHYIVSLIKHVGAVTNLQAAASVLFHHDYRHTSLIYVFDAQEGFVLTNR